MTVYGGLRPTRSLSGANTQVNEYLSTSNGSAIFIGDAVTTPGDSASANPPYPDGTPLVTASGTVTTGALRGACVGVRPTLTNLTLQYAPASTQLGILVADDPFQLFSIASDGTAAHADIGDNISLLSASGSTALGLSAYLAHEATQATSVECLRIIRLLPRVGNAFGTNGVFEVKIDNHELISQTGT